MSVHSHRPKATEQTAKPTQEAPFFQAKLTVNTPGDAYEQEADAVADQVMRMQEGEAPIVQRMPLTSISDVQRKCANCEQEEEQQAQRKETIGGDASGKAAPGIVSDVLSSGAGRPMEGGTREFMESRFGQDFGQVRLHTDSRAAESASAIQARAYTSGRDIVFGAGQYQPESESGKRLLAHELVHVGQQQGGGDVRRFVLSAEDRETYPRLARYLRLSMPEIADNPSLVRSLAANGQLTRRQVRRGVRWGSGPTISIVDLDGANGEFTPDSGSSELRIDMDIVSQLENASSGDLSPAILLVGSTILHEFTHFGDDQDGVDAAGEEGQQMEEQSYGRDIDNMEDAREVIREYRERRRR